MAQFQLNWSNVNVLNNPNATGQRALYRYKTVGGSFLSDGFTPNNDLPTSAITATSKVLNDNVVVQFEVEALCSVNGPTINDNGIQENINFVCITPTLTSIDYQTEECLVDLSSTDVNQVRFTLRLASDNSLVVQSIVNRGSNSASIQQTGLLPSTNYYWQIEFIVTVNNISVYSSDPAYLGSPCSPYPFTTSAAPVCNPATAVTATVIQTS